MDCHEVRELLDAYALGAAEKTEARALERHTADCIRCWEELNKAQRTAALLALSIPMRAAPSYLEGQIMGAIEREHRDAVSRPDAFRRFWLSRPLAAGALGMAALAALVFSGFLQVQMNNLRDDNGDLKEAVAAADAELGQRRQVDAVLSAPDAEKIPMTPASLRSDIAGVYSWSSEYELGFITLSNLPALQPGQVYQAWLVFGEETIPAGACLPVAGTCLLLIGARIVNQKPDGIGVTVEPASVSTAPTGNWLLFASFRSDR